MKNILVGLIVGVAMSGALVPPNAAWAQDSTDVYDPFIDYNEFEVADEEEADINFFRHGRLMTMGLLVGRRNLTEDMREVYKDATVFGLYLSYFFDLRFALQFSYITGNHAIDFTSPLNKKVSGDASTSSLGVDLKYYINTQNVTTGLAALNPYVIVGISSVSRESKVDSRPEFAKDSAMAFDVGAGMEMPFMRNKAYLGIQAMYQLVNFKDESSQIILDNGADPTGIHPTGDFVTLLGIIGMNF